MGLVKEGEEVSPIPGPTILGLTKNHLGDMDIQGKPVPAKRAVKTGVHCRCDKSRLKASHPKKIMEIRLGARPLKRA